jgi:glycosyltransferase involved in cell wall biosynthesis
MKLRILFPYMARWRAVNWTRYHSLLTCLAEKGHEVIVLQPPPLESEETNFQQIDVELPPGIRLVDVGVPPWLWRRKFPLDKLVKKGLYSICSVRVARKIARQEHVDAMLLYNIPQYPLLRIRGPKIIFDYADDYLAMLKHELGRLQNRHVIGLAGRIFDRMIARSDLVLAVSHVLAGTLPGKVHVLPNGVSLEKRAYARAHPLALEIRRPVVGFVGSFEYFIDFDLILGVAELLPETTFLLVGSGREWVRVRDEVQRRRLANVRLVGGVPHQEIFRYIDTMDICLNIFNKGPVADAACPIKLFEYLIMGKPVVTTRLKELEYIDEGFLFYGDTAEEVCGAITSILKQTAEVEARIEKGEKIARERYAWGSIADRFIGYVAGQE